MKKSTRSVLSLALSIIYLLNSAPVLAGGMLKTNGMGKANYVAPNNIPAVSNRLIVKFKPNNLPKGLSVAQINAQLSQPLTSQMLAQLQAAAGATISEMRPTASGAHVLAVASQPTRPSLDKMIAGIASLPNVEYVEEDKIMTAQVATNDTNFTNGLTTGVPGLWGMWPVTPVATPAPGGTGSYGADFQTAWGAATNTTTGTGVVVAVVDTGITPHADIVGAAAAGTIPVTAAGNLVSAGYDFITDCRMRGANAPGGCAATTATASATVAPIADGTDYGDFISTADSTTTGSYFFGTPVSNSSWHGTHVSGTIAALGNNALGVVGGAYTAKILPVRVLGKGGGMTSDIADGIMWAAGVHPTIANPNPAKVINMSLGGGGACSITEQNAINAAVAAGTTVVVAAGNSKADVANFDPASCANVITVAAIARDGSRALYSNFSSPASNTTNPASVTLAAQGGDQSYPATFDPGILSTVNASSAVPDTTAGGSQYAYYQGTSMATPHVAAAVALMKAVNAALTPAQIKAILTAPASLTAFPSFVAANATWDCSLNQNCGAGILNAKLAVQNSVSNGLNGTAVDFGSAAVNATVNKTVTLTNTSAASITLAAAAPVIGGANAADFALVAGGNSCTGAVAAGGSCTVQVSYKPTVTGLHSANLSVSVTGVAAPTIVGLTGLADAPLTTSTPNPTAATVNVGQSTTVSLSYANPNANAVKTAAVMLSNAAIMANSVDNCSNVTLAANASCTVTVTITPTAAGNYTGTASLGLAGGGTQTVATISGTATTPTPPPAPAAGGGGGGCSVMPAGANADASLPLAMLVILAYGMRRRMNRARGEARL